jgi:hypothetical protein
MAIRTPKLDFEVTLKNGWNSVTEAENGWAEFAIGRGKLDGLSRRTDNVR